MTTISANPVRTPAAAPAGPSGTVKVGDATYTVTDGKVSQNGRTIGTITDGGDFNVTIDGQAVRGNVSQLQGAAIEGRLSDGTRVDNRPTGRVIAGGDTFDVRAGEVYRQGVKLGTIDDSGHYNVRLDGKQVTGALTDDPNIRYAARRADGTFVSNLSGPTSAPPGTFTMPPVGSNFIGSIYSAVDMNRQPFSTGADFFDMRPENVDELMGLARSALAQGHEPIMNLHFLVLDENKRLRPDADRIMDKLIADYPDVMKRPGALFEAVDEVFLNPLGRNEAGQPVAGTGGAERIRQAADDAIAALDLLHAKLPEGRLGIVAAPEVWRTDLNSSQFADPAVVPEFQRILTHLKPGDVAGTDPYLWTTDAHDAEVKQQAASEFNAFVKEHAPGVETVLIVQGFVPTDLDKPASEWTQAETDKLAAQIDRLFTTARDYDKTLVWGGASALDGLQSIAERAPQAIKDLFQKWALELGGSPDAVPSTSSEPEPIQFQRPRVFVP